MLSVMPASLYSQCLIKTDNYRLVCADEVRYADSIASGARLYISSRNAYVSSPRSIFNLVEGYGQYFFKVTNSANSQKIAVGRKWVTRIDSTGAGKALIYIRDINVTFTTTESYTAVVDSAISCFQRAVSSGLATLSDGDYGDVAVSGGGLVMTVDKPDLGLHNLADGDFSVVGDSTALSLTGTRAITLQTKNIDGWISRYLQTNKSITLRTNSSGKNSRIFVDTTGANFQFVNGANNASLRVGDSIAVRFNTSGSVGQVLTVTSVDGDGRLVINPKTGGNGTANCEQTLTKNSHGFRKWTPIRWNGSTYVRPTNDTLTPDYIVVDSLTANTFKVANCGTYTTTLTNGLYWYTSISPGYSLISGNVKTPLFQVLNNKLLLNPIIGFRLLSDLGTASLNALSDTAAAIRADFPVASYNGNRTITGSLLTGQNLGTTTDVQTFLDAAFFPSQVPTSTLTSTYNAVTTNSQIIELIASGSPINVTLNWSSGRQASTQPLASTVVNGITVTSNPSAGTSVSGTQAATVVRNTNTTFTNLVTTTDGKTATSSASFTWRAKKYWGTNVGSPNSSQIIAGTNEFSTGASKGAFSIAVGSTANVFYAYPTSFGALTSIIISGLESIGAFTQTTVSVTNASGYIQDYYLYTSNNQFTSTTISFNSVN